MNNPYHDDPKLTAYVLGELSPGEIAAVDQLLAESADARAAVAEIRATADLLTVHLPAEPMPALSSSQKETIMSAPDRQPSRPSKRNAQPAASRSGNSPVVVAACLMVLAVGALVVFNKTDKPRQSGNTIADKETGDGTIGKVLKPTDDNKALARNEKLPIRFDYANKQTSPGNGQVFQNKFSSGQKGQQNQQGQKGKQGNGNQGQPQQNANNGGQSSGQGQGNGSLYGGGSKSGSKSGNSSSGKRGGQTHFGAVVTKPALGLPRNPTSRNWRIPVQSTLRQKQQGLTYYFRTTTASPRIRGFGYFGRGIGGGGRSDLGIYRESRTRINGKVARLARPGLRGVQLREKARILALFDDLKRAQNLSKSSSSPAKESRILGGKGDNYDGKRGKPNSKKKPAKTQAGKPAVEEYTSKEVENVRKHFTKQFQQLAKANPQRELAIMRVKGRVETRLKAIEQQVALAKRIGRPIAAVEGRVVVAEVVKAEVKGLDVDGDGRADFGNESYETIVENKFLTPLADPLSTLSIDVDTASFANTRRFISQGLLPPKDAVRIEELVNYFNYDYTPPKSTSKDPFSVTLEMGTCPWNTKHKLVMVGLKGRELPHDKRPAANLVFLIDVSGSMSSAKKLPLVKLALEMLVDQLQPKDRVSIVTYSNSARTVLEPTAGSERVKILNAIHALRASGGTNGAAGIQLAYTQAQKNFFKAKDGTNRVILCTDGDFNVGIKDTTKLVEFVRGKANKGVFLSVFGFGMGNLKDKRLETLTNKGNGNYGYIDGFNEAKKVFVEEMSGTLFTIAKDVKIQVEFNPAAVASYRLIGYENRIMAAQDFNNDKKDAGEIGAGHTVTALYEIIPATPQTKPTVDKLKYQQRVEPKKGGAKEVLTVKLRYKQPDADKSTKIEFPLKASTKRAAPTEDFEFAAAVAMYGLLLRDSKYAGNANLELVRELAAGAMGKDAEGHRSDFLKLVHKTRTLVARQLGGPVPAPRAFEAGKIGGKK